MHLFYEGYEPSKLLKQSNQRLQFERERLHRQKHPLKCFSEYLEHSSEDEDFGALFTAQNEDS